MPPLPLLQSSCVIVMGGVSQRGSPFSLSLCSGSLQVRTAEWKNPSFCPPPVGWYKGGDSSGPHVRVAHYCLLQQPTPKLVSGFQLWQIPERELMSCVVTIAAMERGKNRPALTNVKSFRDGSIRNAIYM